MELCTKATRDCHVGRRWSTPRFIVKQYITSFMLHNDIVKLLEGHVSSESSLYSPLPVNGTSARVILTRTIQYVIVVLARHGYA